MSRILGNIDKDLGNRTNSIQVQEITVTEEAIAMNGGDCPNSYTLNSRFPFFFLLFSFSFNFFVPIILTKPKFSLPGSNNAKNLLQSSIQEHLRIQQQVFNYRLLGGSLTIADLSPSHNRVGSPQTPIKNYPFMLSANFQIFCKSQHIKHVTSLIHVIYIKIKPA